MQPCLHEEGGFSGWDVTHSNLPKRSWVPPVARGEEVEPADHGELNQMAAPIVSGCGYDGSPVWVHPSSKRDRPGSFGDLVSVEGVQPQTWFVGDEERPVHLWRAARTIREATRKPRPGALLAPALDRWSRWCGGGLSHQAIRGHFLGAAKLSGLAARARQLVLKMLWGLVALKGPAGAHPCVLCGGARGPLPEAHMFWECREVQCVWDEVARALQRDRQGDAGAWDCGGRQPEDFLAPAGDPGVEKKWRRAIWVGAVWGIWRAINWATHHPGSPVSVRLVAWREARTVWCDLLRADSRSQDEKRRSGKEEEREWHETKWEEVWNSLLGVAMRQGAVGEGRRRQSGRADLRGRIWRSMGGDDPT